MADWKKPRGKDRALGIAFSDYHESFSAGIAEISLDRKTGRIKVHDYWIAGDAGIIVQPENAHAQLEGAVVYGLGSALTEELTYKDGAVQQSNFHDYRLIRMSDMPQIHTKIIVTDNSPTGLGELGVPTVAPAIGNAVFKLTGKRLRQLPMSASRVSASLKA
jgi:isoquinoline 1-oxidoreductase beta subunit